MPSTECNFRSHRINLPGIDVHHYIYAMSIIYSQVELTNENPNLQERFFARYRTLYCTVLYYTVVEHVEHVLEEVCSRFQPSNSMGLL
jgi:hypothetical protein